MRNRLPAATMITLRHRLMPPSVWLRARSNARVSSRNARSSRYARRTSDSLIAQTFSMRVRAKEQIVRSLTVAIGVLCIACGESENSASELTRRLVADLRIGSENDGDAYRFTSIRDVEVLNDTVFVSQSGQPEVRVFAPTGVHLRTIGRSGTGPGEFESISSFGFSVTRSG